MLSNLYMLISHLYILSTKVSAHIALFILINLGSLFSYREVFVLFCFTTSLNILRAYLSLDMCFENTFS